MKTSSAQFDLMVTFMEQHGDLSKPNSNARGRLATMGSWEELTTLLNSDGSGDTKTSEKWKKVWSDFKNNTKKKAARLNKAVRGTGGGPAVHSKLTDLEQRVLNIIGVKAATGLAVTEAGLPQGITIQDRAVPMLPTTLPPESPPQPLAPPRVPVHVEISQIQDYSETWNTPGPSTRSHTPPPHSSLEGMPSRDEHICQPQPASQASPPLLQDTDMVTPNLSPSQVHVAPPQHPALTGQTPSRRGRETRTRGSPRRIRMTHTEQAAQQFLRSDQEWRNFKLTQHRDYMDIREQNRIRLLEVETQREWQRIGMRALDILNKLVDK